MIDIIGALLINLLIPGELISTAGDAISLHQGIASRRLVSFDYQDGVGDRSHRLVEGYALGQSRGGHLLYRAYTLRGTGDGVGGWRLYRVDRMASVRLSDACYPANRALYRRGDKAMGVIFIEADQGR